MPGGGAERRAVSGPVGRLPAGRRRGHRPGRHLGRAGGPGLRRQPASDPARGGGARRAHPLDRRPKGRPGPPDRARPRGSSNGPRPGSRPSTASSSPAWPTTSSSICTSCSTGPSGPGWRRGPRRSRHEPTAGPTSTTTASPPLVQVLDRRGIAEVAGRERPEWSPAISLDMMDRQGIERHCSGCRPPECTSATTRRPGGSPGPATGSVPGWSPTTPGDSATSPRCPCPTSTVRSRRSGTRSTTSGVAGLVLQSSNSDGSYLGDPRFDPVLAELDRRGALVFVHPAVPVFAAGLPIDIPVFAMEFTFDTRGGLQPGLHGGARAVPEHPVDPQPCRRHGPVPGEPVQPAVAHRCRACRTGSRRSARLPVADLVRHRAVGQSARPLLARRVGRSRDHVVFGSDFPFAPELAAQLSVLSLDTDDRFGEVGRELVRRGNVLRLLGGG